MFPAVMFISSSSACYFSTFPASHYLAPLALFFKVVSITIAFIYFKSTAFTTCFSTTSCIVTKHTMVSTFCLVAIATFVCFIPGHGSSRSIFQFQLSILSAMYFSSALFRASDLIKPNILSFTKLDIHFSTFCTCILFTINSSLGEEVSSVASYLISTVLSSLFPPLPTDESPHMGYNGSSEV
jgi:hypothetical protein